MSPISPNDPTRRLTLKPSFTSRRDPFVLIYRVDVPTRQTKLLKAARTHIYLLKRVKVLLTLQKCLEGMANPPEDKLERLIKDITEINTRINHLNAIMDRCQSTVVISSSTYDEMKAEVSRDANDQDESSAADSKSGSREFVVCFTKDDPPSHLLNKEEPLIVHYVDVSPPLLEIPICDIIV